MQGILYYDEEHNRELLINLDNLLYLLHIKKRLGDKVDIKDRLFGYCGCGECTNSPFIFSTIAVILDLSEAEEREIEENFWDVQDWQENNPGYQNKLNPEEVETVWEVIVPCSYAAEEIIERIDNQTVSILEVREDSAGNKYFYLAADCWETTEYDILDIFIQIREAAESLKKGEKKSD